MDPCSSFEDEVLEKGILNILTGRCSKEEEPVEEYREEPYQTEPEETMMSFLEKAEREQFCDLVLD